MGQINSVNQTIPQYNVAGYKPGDAIGAGVVIDPRETKAFGSDDVKMVTIDYNADGQKQVNETLQLMVKLPPKGFVPQNWKGAATENHSMLGGYLGGGVLGAIGGGIVGGLSGAAAESAARGGIFGAKAATSVGAGRVGLAVGVAIAVTGIVIGARMVTADARKAVNDDVDNARRASVPDLIPAKNVLNIPSYDK